MAPLPVAIILSVVRMTLAWPALLSARLLPIVEAQTRVLVILRHEVLVHGRCFGEAEHVEVLHDAGASVEKYAHFFWALVAIVNIRRA